MRFNSRLAIPLFGSLILACLGIAFFIYQESKELALKKSQNATAALELHRAKQSIKSQKPLEALRLAKEQKNFNDDWAELSIVAADQLKDYTLLNSLYEKFPHLFQDKEEVILSVADGYIQEMRYSDFWNLKEQWSHSQKHSDQWTLLEADCFACAGDPLKASQILESRSLGKAWESARLVRLSLLSINEHPQISWEYLSQACKIDNSNPDLKLYRTHLLTSASKDLLAVEELSNLVAAFPNKPIFFEELVDAHLRLNNYAAASELLKAQIATSTNDQLFVKALFLNQVFAPIPLRKDALEDCLNPIIHQLISEKPLSQELFADNEELFWLQVMALLKSEKEIEVFTLLAEKNTPLQHQNKLRTGLMQALSYRHPELNYSFHVLEDAHVHPLFRQLNMLPYPPELQQLLSNSAIFPALFLAAGWPEAALQLHREQTRLSEDLPSWVPYGLTQAYARNRNISTAINFAKNQKRSPQLSLLLGELYLKSEERDLGEAKLKYLASSDSPIGRKAVQILLNEYIKFKKFAEAKEVLKLNSTFSESLAGQKILAELSLKLGDRKTAEAIYKRIVKKSPEAKSYFAQKAFHEKNYALALRITQELYRENPKNEQLRDNLKKISQALRSYPKASI